ncbi:hypothetical protein BC629DRAFT_189777 [Irpex lacteus]|nr:hypothetical protein BC629DRAFT_189777 [Irpex lacteus]
MVPLARIRVDGILGAPFIGNLATAVLYGMACLQTYIVFKQKKGRMWLRSLVVALWILATLHLIAVSSALYYWLISNYANFEALATQNIWAATTYYIVTAILEFTIRGYESIVSDKGS